MKHKEIEHRGARAVTVFIVIVVASTSLWLYTGSEDVTWWMSAVAVLVAFAAASGVASLLDRRSENA